MCICICICICVLISVNGYIKILIHTYTHIHTCTYTYNIIEDVRGLGECLACPPGYISNPGSKEKRDCVNPIPNFVFAFFFLVVLAFTIVLYVSHGRFHRVAFVRKARAYKQFLQAAKVVCVPIHT